MMETEYFDVLCHTRLTRPVLEAALKISWWAFKAEVETLDWWYKYVGTIVKGVSVGDYEIVDRPNGDDKLGDPHADFRFPLAVTHEHPIDPATIASIIMAIAILFIALSIFAVTVTVVAPPPTGLGGVGALLLLGLAVLGLYFYSRSKR